MRKTITQTFRFAAIALILLGLAFVSAHRLHGSKTLRVSMQVRVLPEPIKEWIYVAQSHNEHDIGITEGQVVAYLGSKTWKPIFKIDSLLLSVKSSSNGKFLAVLACTRRPAPGHPGKLFLEMVDSFGAPVMSWSFPWEYDRPVPSLAVADDGSQVALGWADVGVVQYFRPNSNNPLTIDLFPDDEYGYERNLYLARDDSSNFFLVLATQRGLNPAAENPDARSASPKLFWLDTRGQIVRSTAVDAEGISAFHFDENSRLIVIGGTDFPEPDRPVPFAEIRSAKGHILTRVKNVTPEYFTVSADRRIVVLSSPSQIVVADFVQRLELWRHAIQTESRSILAVAITEEPKAVAFLSAVVRYKNKTFIYDSPRVSFVTTDGKELGETDFPGTFLARAVLVPDPGRGLRVLTQDRIWTISLAR